MPAGALRAQQIIVVVCVLNLLLPGVFAQEIEGEAAFEIPEFDPIIAAEQSLLLGEDGTVQSVPATSTFGIFRMILTLAVVAVAIYGLVFVIKRAFRGNRTRDPFLKVLASVPLGTNRSAHIISVGSQAWLVGAAENGVHLISEITDNDVLNAMLLEDSRKSVLPSANGPVVNTGRFMTLLRRLGMPVETGEPTPESIRKRREKLKGL